MRGISAVLAGGGSVTLLYSNAFRTTFTPSRCPVGLSVLRMTEQSPPALQLALSASSRSPDVTPCLRLFVRRCLRHCFRRNRSLPYPRLLLPHNLPARNQPCPAPGLTTPRLNRLLPFLPRFRILAHPRVLRRERYTQLLEARQGRDGPECFDERRRGGRVEVFNGHGAEARGI